MLRLFEKKIKESKKMKIQNAIKLLKKHIGKVDWLVAIGEAYGEHRNKIVIFKKNGVKINFGITDWKGFGICFGERVAKAEEPETQIEETPPPF